MYAEKEVPLQRKTQSPHFMGNSAGDVSAAKGNSAGDISAAKDNSTGDISAAKDNSAGDVSAAKGNSAGDVSVTKDNGVMDISVIIPLFNEEESLKKLYEWIARVCAQEGLSYEVLFVDDGSTDGSWQVVEELKKADREHVRGIRFRRNYGKSAALYCGFRAAQGEVVITMDADLQDSPDEIPGLVRMIREEGYDLVSGWKKKRYDNALTKNLPSKLFNATARRVTGLHLHDMNCGLKAYRQEVVKNIEVFSEMHRYIPYLAKNAGFTKIGEKVVQHRKREFGVSKFGLNRFVNGYLEQVRQATDALLRADRESDVLPRLCGNSSCWGHETLRPAPRRACHAGRDQSVFPPEHTDDGAWLHAVSGRLFRRAHNPQLTVAQRLPHPRGTLSRSLPTLIPDCL